MLRLFVLFVMLSGIVVHVQAEEIPLESCDRLPAIYVSVSGMKLLLLVDTAATSMLNLKSFPRGDARRLSVTSWNGTEQTNAQEISVGDLADRGTSL